MKELINKKGYVSVETIIVAGLIIASGAFILAVFSRQANNINHDASGQMLSAQSEQQSSYNAMGATANALVGNQVEAFEKVMIEDEGSGLPGDYNPCHYNPCRLAG